MTRARQVSKLVNPSVFTVDSSDNVGLNSTSPNQKLTVVGVVSATSFIGDGSNLEGVASAGLGTALSDGDDAGSVIYYTDTTLGIGSTVVVQPPATTNVAYTQYELISLDEDVDLIVAEGDDFVPDILALEDGAMTYGISGSGTGGGGISNVVEDTSPQLGGNLDLNSKRIDGTGQINIAGGLQISGIATANKFIGDGSGLTNVTAVGTGIGVSNSGTTVGTAQTINFGSGITISNVNAGFATVSVSEVFTGVGVSDSGSAVGTAQTVNFGTGLSASLTGGYVTITNTVSGGDTADVSTSTLNVVGVSTLAGAVSVGDTISLGDHDRLRFGANQDLQIYHNSVNYIDVTQPTYFRSSHGSGSQFYFQATSGEQSLVLNDSGSVDLYYDNSKKFETTNSGVSVTGGLVATGIATAPGVVVTGIATATGIRISGNAGIITATGHVDSGIVTYRGDSSYSAAGRWVLGADGTNHYTFTGPGLGHSTLNDPTLYLMRGQTYMFENKMGAHPFRIQSTSNGSTGTQWNVGVTNNDVSNGVLIFEVPFVCPNTLYYQCTAHANMGGVLNIVT